MQISPRTTSRQDQLHNEFHRMLLGHPDCALPWFPPSDFSLKQPLRRKRPESQVHDSMGLFKVMGEAVPATEETPLCALASWVALSVLYRLTQLGASAATNQAPPPLG